jgi:exodeoxyribonuclease V alpha subunit
VAIAEHIVELRTNYRFGADSGIHGLSQFVNAGDAAGAIELLKTGRRSDVEFAPTPAATALVEALRSRVIEGYRAFLTAATPDEALRRLGDFRILCATRRGPFGVENINRLAEQALTDEALIEPAATHYHGRPVLIRTNDYQLRLFNGDVGLILRDPESGDQLRAFFLDAEGRQRRVLPARLPAHETTFAMTVHKSQGSEFPGVLLILPERDVAVLTRELVYTGLTRARTSVELWASVEVLRTAIERRTERSSGLRDALWKTPSRQTL